MNIDSSLASCKEKITPKKTLEKQKTKPINKSFDLHECRRQGQKCGANWPVKNNTWQMKINNVFVKTSVFKLVSCRREEADMVAWRGSKHSEGTAVGKALGYLNIFWAATRGYLSSG